MPSSPVMPLFDIFGTLVFTQKAINDVFWSLVVDDMTLGGEVVRWTGKRINSRIAAVGAYLADRVPHPSCGRLARYVLFVGSSASRSCCLGSGGTTVADCRCLSLIGGTRGAALQKRRRPRSPCGGAAPLPSRPNGAGLLGLRPSTGRDGHGWDRRPTFPPLAGGYFQRRGRPGGRAAHTELTGRGSHFFFFCILSVLSTPFAGTTARVGDSFCDARIALEAVKELRPTVLGTVAAAGESSYRAQGPASPPGIGDSGLGRGGPAGHCGGAGGCE
ncbi:hypothetical protein NDU88_002684 [Pleurodeles waltl]|uniref:Uncharacterized protein n=1 Tax=Pleurodeles waltl TaxID=8319 RepID=A0AAV7UY29_PLEWA|nr:hypothetical protein NDU88_002684 [Pleurodeles waltl]